MDDNGQLHIDYLIGIAIFLVSIIFVFSYVTGLFIPFQSSSDEVTIIADRVATNIVEQKMSANDPGMTNLLNATKVDSFFTNIYDDYMSTLDILGLRGSYLSYDLNVTITNIDDNMITHAEGKALPFKGNIGQTIRVVKIMNEEGNVSSAILAVRVW